MNTSIRNVSFAYELDCDTEAAPLDAAALSEISIDFPPGSCTLITGRSGSGKSTILKLINGLIPELYKGKLEGDVVVDGLDTTSADIQQLGRHVGMVFQNPRSQFFTASVLEELAFANENAGEEAQIINNYIANALKTWSIESFASRKLRELSGGELQVVACAAATAGPQRLLLFDEPTSNLSPRAIEAFTRVIRKLKAEGYTLVIAEHRIYPLNGLADQVVIMDNGHIKRLLSGEDFFTMSDTERRELGLRTLSCPAVKISALPIRENREGIEVSNLRFSYGKRRILDIPRLYLPAGQVVALTGENGAGKSTLARNLIGLAKPEKGSRICFHDKPCGHAARQKLSALVMQDVNRQLFAETVTAEVCLGNDGLSQQSVAELLASLGLEGLETRHPMTLSGGQKQRLVIANALASDAQLYVFDEPTSGVDFQHLISISAHIRNLAEAGKCVLVISHDWEFINEVADIEINLRALNEDGSSQLTYRALKGE